MSVLLGLGVGYVLFVLALGIVKMSHVEAQVENEAEWHKRGVGAGRWCRRWTRLEDVHPLEVLPTSQAL